MRVKPAHGRTRALTTYTKGVPRAFRETPMDPTAIRVRNLMATIERRRQEKKPDEQLLRAYRLGLIVLKWREAHEGVLPG